MIRTVLTIRVVRHSKNDYKFLEQIDGFSDSYDTDDLYGINEYMQIHYNYNVEFSFWHRHRIKQQINRKRGRVITFSTITPGKPMLSAKTKRALWASLLIFATTYLSALIGLPVASDRIDVPVGIQESWLLSFIPSTIAALTRFSNELGMSLKNE